MAISKLSRDAKHNGKGLKAQEFSVSEIHYGIFSNMF